MENKHTKAPWVKGNSDHQIMILGGAGRNYICHVTITQTGGGGIAKSMETEREANANLIMAAPDLLEALVTANTILKNEFPLFSDWPESKIIESAITKAKLG